MNFLDRLSENRTLALVVLVVYYVLVTIPHEILGRFINRQFEIVSKETYNMIILVAVVVMMVVGLLIALRKLREHPRPRLWLTYFGVSVAAVFLSMYYLFIINIEVIHFVQYCVFAILCYALTRNYYSILTWALLAGALDELHQYLVLNPTGTNYFDFNDVVINTIGAIFGLLILNLFGRRSEKMPLAERWTSPLFYTLYALIVLWVIAFATGWASYRPTGESTFIVYREMPTEFWSWVGKKIVYHVMMPWEYLLVTAAIYIGYEPLLRGVVEPRS